MIDSPRSKTTTGAPAPPPFDAAAGLLVSVRNAAEAEAALAGGAAVVDVKEPSRGALGAADRATLAEVVRVVGGRRPVTAAAGELQHPDQLDAYAGLGLSLVKVGLAGFAGRAGWPSLLRSASDAIGEAQLVPVAYADHQCCRAPRADEVLRVVEKLGLDWLMVDTSDKLGGGLWDCWSLEQAAAIIAEAHRRRVRIALAGRLDARGVRVAAALGADLIGVRGAASGGDRLGPIDAGLVRELSTELLHAAPAAGGEKI